MDREELARLDSGVRHFDQLPRQAGMVQTTEQRRSEKLTHIEMLRELIRLYERDLTSMLSASRPEKLGRKGDA